MLHRFLVVFHFPRVDQIIRIHIYCFFLRIEEDPDFYTARANTYDSQLKRIVAQIRATWPAVKIIVRGDSGFCRDEIMAWCEANHIDFVFGLAKNERLKAKIVEESRQLSSCTRERSRPRGFSKTSVMRLGRAGHGSIGWWQKQNIWKREPIRDLSSRLSTGNCSMPSIASVDATIHHFHALGCATGAWGTVAKLRMLHKP